jgi:hypothetical protein
MSKNPATKANEVFVDVSGASAGFAGPGAVGDSDDTTLVANERNAKGYPVGTTSFAGNDNEA